jgi:hypothetical protein
MGEKPTTTWIIPSLDLFALNKRQDHKNGQRVAFQSLYFFSLTKEKIPVRCRTAAPDWFFETNTLLCAPSMLIHKEVKFDNFNMNNHCMNNLRIPMGEGTEMTIQLSAESVSLKRVIDVEDDEQEKKRPRLEKE